MRTLRSLAVVASLFLSRLVLAKTDFSVSTGNLSAWNQSDWSLTTNTYLPGQYQSRLSLANGYVAPIAQERQIFKWLLTRNRYVGASLAAAGPFEVPVQV